MLAFEQLGDDMIIDRAAKRTVEIIVLCLIATPSMADPMTGEELMSLYATDVTECGSYLKNGELIPYCEHWRLDGKIAGKDFMKYAGKFRIEAVDALVCKKYGSSREYCVPLEHISGDTYTTSFSDGSQANVTIVKGDTENLE